MIESSKEIVSKAIKDFKPYAVIMMFSGGDDSLTAYHVAKELGVKIDAVIFGNTRTGVQETTDFVRAKVAEMGDRYIEADAGDSYEKYVLRKGFFGVGSRAHNYSYHILKYNHFSKAISKHIRQGRKGYKILFLNGGRKNESANRQKSMAIPIKRTERAPNDIWVNVINEWGKETDCLPYLEGNSIIRNPVSIQLCRSGECMCGTMQELQAAHEAAAVFPKWGTWWKEVRKAVTAKFPWDWGEQMPKGFKPPKPKQLSLFQPMCVGCQSQKRFKTVTSQTVLTL